MRPLLRIAGVVSLLALAAGCSRQPLYTKLNEREANEQVALLRSVSIDARKDLREGTYTVSVNDGDFARSVDLLRERGFPRKRFENRGTVFKAEGFVTSPAQEQQRRLFAISQEVSHSLSIFPEVLDVNVVIDMPEKNPLADKTVAPRASVVAQFRQGTDAGNIDVMKSKIRQTVVSSVEGMTPDHVSVEYSMAEGPTAWSKTPSTTPEAASWFGMPWPLALSFLLGFAALLGALVFRWFGRKQASGSNGKGGGSSGSFAAAPYRGPAVRRGDADVPA